jgi:hypothetical protein
MGQHLGHGSCCMEKGTAIRRFYLARISGLLDREVARLVLLVLKHMLTLLLTLTILLKSMPTPMLTRILILTLRSITQTLSLGTENQLCRNAQNAQTRVLAVSRYWNIGC